MQFYEPISKVIKTDYAEAVAQWEKAGNKITVLPSYNQTHKAQHHIDRAEQVTPRHVITQFNDWLTAKPGRIAKFRKHILISEKYLSNIRRHLAPCKAGLFKRFEQAMTAIEQGEKK